MQASKDLPLCTRPCHGTAIRPIRKRLWELKNVKLQGSSPKQWLSKSRLFPDPCGLFVGGLFECSRLRFSRTCQRANLQSVLSEFDELAKGDNSAKAVERFHDVFPSLPKTYQKAPVLWNSVLATFSNAGDFEGALMWFNKARDAGIQANARAFGKMMEAAARAGRPDLAKEWLERLESTGGDYNPTAVSILLYAFASVDRVEEADEVLRQKISRGYINLIDYNTVAEAYAKRGEPSKVVQLLKEAELAGEALDATSYTALITAHARGSQIDAAAASLHSMQSASLQPDLIAHNALVNGYCKEGQVKEARLHLQSMIQSQLEVDALSFTPIVQVCANSGSLRDALNWLEAMRNHKVLPDIAAYTTVLDACAKSDQVSDAEVAVQVFESLSNARVHPDTVAMNTLINCAAKCGDGNAALKFLEEMKKVGKHGEYRAKPSVQTYTSMIKALANQQEMDLDQAFKLLEEAISLGLSPDLILYNVLLSACAKARDARRAQQTFQRLLAQGLRPDVHSYTALLHVYAAIGDVEGAADLIAEMQEVGVKPNKFTWAGMLKACERAKDSVWACVTLRQMAALGAQTDELILKRFERIVGSELARQVMPKTSSRRISLRP
ncbi:Pentatricopeptide repeat-containing protein At5g39710 (Protein EMBRYO DEFECTIVE 2745) [Durusdinium trenchii]|uniref:Pentatricopeptide repeat-containing protein At5g39710 (Protein EMBRYO DEFECTIVE 2745) n=1 Tax=Durusdinium trenchii TaxID=1381693 RepID=A0ABP0LLB9_9DINO